MTKRNVFSTDEGNKDVEKKNVKNYPSAKDNMISLIRYAGPSNSDVK